MHGQTNIKSLDNNNFNPQSLIFLLKINLFLVKINLKWAQGYFIYI